MKTIVIVLLVLIGGCCSTKTVMQTDKVPYKPDPVIDSLKTLLALKLEPNCDSAIAAAVEKFGNFKDTSTSAQGDTWAVTVKTLLDSIDVLNKTKHYTRETSITVQPHSDSTDYSYPQTQITLMSLYDRIRLAAFIPLVILLIGSWLLLMLVMNPVAGSGTILDRLIGLIKKP
jgi:hypothetical protein